MATTIWLDMDGTLADFYNVPNWKEKLDAGKTTPYHDAKPLFDVDEFVELIQAFNEYGIHVGVITWGSKNADASFNRRISTVKKNWLKRNGLEMIVDRYIFLNYGEDKSTYPSNALKNILIDDDDSVREKWNEKFPNSAIHPNENGNTLYRIMFNLLSDFVEGRKEI